MQYLGFSATFHLFSNSVQLKICCYIINVFFVAVNDSVLHLIVDVTVVPEHMLSAPTKKCHSSPLNTFHAREHVVGEHTLFNH